MTSFKLLRGDDLFYALPDGRKLCYRSYGATQGTPLVLIAGLGLQLIYWPPSLVAGLVDRGFQVIVFDNRDVGRSSCINTPAPAPWRKFLRRPRADAYAIADMAADLLALLDHLTVVKIHLVGMSMGGMIAQAFASAYPERCITLTSIFSSTGASNVGQPAISSVLKLMRAPAQTQEQAVANYVSRTKAIDSTRFAVDTEALALYAKHAWERGLRTKAQEGVDRQIGAILKSGDRTQELKRITAPTLVIHGDRDLMVAPSGGYATTAAIRGANLVLIAGMGHLISAAVTPLLLDLLQGHIRRHSSVDQNLAASSLAA